MSSPGNAAASMIVQAQSIVQDLMVQAGEIQAAIKRQQTLIESLTPVAEWAQAGPSGPGLTPPESAEATSESPADGVASSVEEPQL